MVKILNERLPKQKISAKYVKMRLMSELLSNVISLVVLLALFSCYYIFNWPTWAFCTILILLAITVLGLSWSCLEPKLAYQNWRYQIDDEYVQIAHGIFKKKWVTIPVTKIQAVTTSQGPVMKRYQLRAIKV